MKWIQEYQDQWINKVEYLVNKANIILHVYNVYVFFKNSSMHCASMCIFVHRQEKHGMDEYTLNLNYI